MLLTGYATFHADQSLISACTLSLDHIEQHALVNSL